jgi:hypothetical protein
MELTHPRLRRTLATSVALSGGNSCGASFLALSSRAIAVCISCKIAAGLMACSPGSSLRSARHSDFRLLRSIYKHKFLFRKMFGTYRRQRLPQRCPAQHNRAR